MKYFRAIKGAAVSQLGNCEMAALLNICMKFFHIRVIIYYNVMKGRKFSMMLDKNSQQPLYVQLMRVIKDNIQNGQYKKLETRSRRKQHCPIHMVSAESRCARR